jgi:outer membrane protein insertion porin family
MTSPLRPALIPLWLLAAFCFLFPSGASASPSIEVREVRVEGLRSMEKSDLLYLLEIRPGRSLDPVTLRRGIQRAFLKGIFENITVETEEGSPGTVVVKVKERDFIDDIDVEGNENIPRKFVLSHLGLSEGRVMRYDLLARIRGNLIEAVREKGYPSAGAVIDVNPTGDPYRVEVVVRIKEGPPLRIYRIVIVGQPAEEVKFYMRLSEGDVYDQFKLKKDMERIEKHYRDSGYLNPAVGPYTFSDGVLTLGVEPGKKLLMEFKGNDAVSARLLRGVTPFSEAGAVRDDLIEEAVAKMTALYHEKGYPFVQIAPVEAEGDGEIRLNFYIFEGRKVYVDSMEIAGSSLPEENLKAIMSLRKGEVYNPDLLDSDVGRLEDFYNALGYLDASFSEPEVKIVGEGASIYVTVSEGKKYEITHIGVEGVKSIPGEKIYEAIGLKAGAPYNEVDVADARRRVINLYRNHGFLDVRVEVKRDFEEGSVKVVFRVDEGAVYYFGETVVIGNAQTNPEVVKRELGYEQGKPLDVGKLVAARQKLYRLGIFRDVDLRPLESYDHTSDIAVEVQESKPGVVEFGFGYSEYERYRGFVDIGYRNLFGTDKQVSFRTELSSLARRFILNYRDPWFLGRPVPMRASLLREEKKEENIDTGEVMYRLRRTTATIGIEESLGERMKLDLPYEFSLVKTFDVRPDVVLSREDVGTLAISSVIPAISYDTRDNPFDPKRGVFAGASLKFATFALLSQTDFLKVQAHASTYARLSRWIVLAVGARGGVAQGLRDTNELPLVERFFLGGRNSVRGFAQDTLGPKGKDGNPTGGNAFFQGNVELRFRVSRNWRLVAFVDSGNVWREISGFDPLQLRYSVGGGLRYSTPVGPVRVDYGHKINRRLGETSGELHFSIGHAF